jgi:hypothetical protein
MRRPVSVKPVELNAKRIADKGIRPPLVVERIQHHLDAIIFINVFASRHVRTDELRVGVKATKTT